MPPDTPQPRSGTFGGHPTLARCQVTTHRCQVTTIRSKSLGEAMPQCSPMPQARGVQASRTSYVALATWRASLWIVSEPLGEAREAVPQRRDWSEACEGGRATNAETGQEHVREGGVPCTSTRPRSGGRCMWHLRGRATWHAQAGGYNATSDAQMLWWVRCHKLTVPAHCPHPIMLDVPTNCLHPL